MNCHYETTIKELVDVIIDLLAEVNIFVHGNYENFRI